jgi:hypothetical protein
MKIAFFSRSLVVFVAASTATILTVSGGEMSEKVKTLHQETTAQLEAIQQLPAEEQARERLKIIQVQQQKRQVLAEQALNSLPPAALPATFSPRQKPENLTADQESLWQAREQLRKSRFELGKQLEQAANAQERGAIASQWRRQNEASIRDLCQKEKQARQGAAPDFLGSAIPEAPAHWNNAEQALWAEHWTLRREKAHMLEESKALPSREKLQRLRAWQAQHGAREKELQQWVADTKALDQQQQ